MGRANIVISESSLSLGPSKAAQNLEASHRLVECFSRQVERGKLPTIAESTYITSRRWFVELSPKLVVSIIILIALSSTGIARAKLDLSPDNLPLQSSINDEPSPKQTSKCDACRLLVKSFEKGIESTNRGKHEGGDTSWEEKNLKNYADSEVRLVEIQEKLCEEVKTGKPECLSLAEEYESDIEEWWFMQRRKNVRLDDYLCISRLKFCCPKGKFGPTCQSCPSECNQHGNCDGSGTRTGSGKCHCDQGYEGDFCENCSENYFSIPTSGDKFACRECDSACIGCYGFGPLNCTNCRPGYKKVEKKGCLDIDECTEGIEGDGNTRICKENMYCVNTEGSYRCADCHVSCAGCLGYGPNMCLACAEGYKADEDYVCQSLDQMDRFRAEDRLLNSDDVILRYLLYVGVLLVSTLVFRTHSFLLYFSLIVFVTICALSELDFILNDVDMPDKKPD